MNEMLSVKQLNEVLKALHNRNELPELGTFSEVDIVFVAGLFLWYMQHKDDNWTKILRFFNIDKSDANDNKFNHSHYFKQIEELYKVKHDQIFDNFPYAKNADANSFSRFFAPPIHITNETIDWFFEKIWQFTQEYVRGLHELARNIVEHSGEKFNNGQGMITIRAYSISETDKTKILETHVFDYGTKGILPQLKEYTDKNSKDDNIKNQSVKECYTIDSEKLTPDFKLINFIKPVGLPLAQQRFRHIGHYGINKLQNLVEEKPLEGKMYVASRGIDGNRDYYESDNAENYTIDVGTSYFFEIPFIANNFKEIKLPKLKDKRINTLGDPESLKELLQKNIKHISLKEISDSDTESLKKMFQKNVRHISLKEIPNIEERFDDIMDIHLSKKITKVNFDEIICDLFKLPKMPNSKAVITLNLENGVDGESNLLRFLGHLSFEYDKQSFVIYNLDFDVFNKMVEDNKAFAKSRKWQFFWNEDKDNGILVLTKHCFAKDGNNKIFYFADILYGVNIESYNHINKMLSNTFPNSATIVDKDVRNTNTVHIEPLKSFFYQNALLPYDILLEKEKRPLFLNNIKTILQNNLIGRNLFKDNGYSSIKIIENYIENFDGYHISNTHFKIGNKIHSSDFYYAKGLFQNSFYTVRLAIHLANKIHHDITDSAIKMAKLVINEVNNIFNKDTSGIDLANEIIINLNKTIVESSDENKKIIIKVSSIIKHKTEEINNKFEALRNTINLAKNGNNIFKDITISTSNLPDEIGNIVKNSFIKELRSITLVGHEMYSELLLSLIENYLRIIYGYDVEHFVDQNEDVKLTFLSENVYEKDLRNYNERKIIIIVPIAATGSTAKKIEKNISNKVKNANGNSVVNDIFLAPYYNIIWAKSNNPKFKKYIETENQTEIINLTPEWHEIKDCQLCYGIGVNNYPVKTEPLFDTDNSSLTPALFFGYPKGQTKLEPNEIESIMKFDELKFEHSIKYICVSRNDNYRIYDVDSDKFLEKNQDRIIRWLERVVKPCLDEMTEQKIVSFFQEKIEKIEKPQREEFFLSYQHMEIPTLEEEWFEKYIDLYRKDKTSAYKKWTLQLNKHVKFCKLKLTDKVIIVAPCHESNSQFLNLINEHVFSSAATIIQHQSGVDFVENFWILYKDYLTSENTKVFYVDDSLISGKHFFELYDFIKEVSGKKLPLTASILLNDQAIPFIHDRVVKRSNNYFSFASYNQPPTINILNKRPLEHERKRYEQLMKDSLHDTLIETFHLKANKLNPSKPKDKDETYEKRIRRLKMFEATHKIYAHFTKKDTNISDISKIVDFKLEYEDKKNNDDDEDMGQKALLKVLSQYPFILHEPLRKKTFKWYKILLSEILSNTCFDINKDFTTFKFLFRRASFLGNYAVLEEKFLKKLLEWFIQIDNNLNNNPQGDDKLHNFPIFVLRNYVEMIQKNGWVAYHILKNVKTVDFNKSNQGRQFLCMLQMEASSVIDDFMKMVAKEHPIKWRNIYKGNSNLITTTEEIKQFFEDRPDLLKTNKCLIIKETFLDNFGILEKAEFINYLWIKQLLYVDCDDYEPHLLKEIGYQKKIDNIIEKMKGFFLEIEEVQAFFIVTDGKQKPYVLSPQDNFILNEFSDEFDTNKRIETYNENLKKIIELLGEKEKLDKDETEKIKEIIDEVERQKELTIKVSIDALKKVAKQLDEKENLTIEEIEKNKKLINNELIDKKEKQKNLPTKTLIDFLNGMPCNTSNATETTAEFVFKNGEWTNIYDVFSDNRGVNLTFMPPKYEYKWLYLIRISKLKEDKNGKCEFETLGLLGFYSKEDLRKNILPKQLLMLLRQDMGKFIEKHHKNDEFSNLILQKEQADYLVMLRHGMDTYASPIKFYTKQLDKKLIDTVRENYKYILSFHNLKLEYSDDMNPDDIDSLVKLVDITTESDKTIKTKFPKKLKEQIIFEVIYNIRRHVFTTYYDFVYSSNSKKIEIVLAVIKADDGTTYFTITNNYCDKEENETERNLSIISKKDDGLNLIYNILKKINLGKVFIKINNSNIDAENNKFTVNIPLIQNK